MNIVKAAKESISNHTIQWAKATNCTDDSKFVEHNGVPTINVAVLLGISTSKARQLLNKAHKNGLICKSKNNAGKYCRWLPVGYLREIKSAA